MEAASESSAEAVSVLASMPNTPQRQHRAANAANNRRKRFIAISTELNYLFFKFPFQVPDYFALVTRALIVLEGIALTGDPSFDIFDAAYPYAQKRAINVAKELSMADALTLMKGAVALRAELQRTDAHAR
jgi:predicted unusual protein kinase regulating ubiquinone biosynthesis (AarF/ABC1/UbiB family)